MMASNPRRFRLARFGIGLSLGLSLGGCVGKVSEGPDAAPGNPSGSGASGGSTGSGATGAGGAGSGASSSGGSASGGSASGGGSSATGGNGTGGSSSSSGGSASGGTSATAPTFACDPAAAPPAESLRRLTMTQYANSVRDLIAWAVANDDDSIDDVTDAIAPALGALPDDVRQAVPQDLHGSYRRLDQTLQQEKRIRDLADRQRDVFRRSGN